MAAIGAKAQISGSHGGGETGGDRLLAERQVARALDQILQEQVERALFGLANFDLGAVEAKPRLLADIVIEVCLRRERAILDRGHEISLGAGPKWVWAGAT